MLEHPEIGWIERTGYPSWRQEALLDGDPEDEEEEDYDSEFRGDEDEDRLYEERRERELYGE